MDLILEFDVVLGRRGGRMELKDEAGNSSRYARFLDTPVYCEDGNKDAALSSPDSWRTE
jgi:hypothetical protein